MYKICGKLGIEAPKLYALISKKAEGKKTKTLGLHVQVMGGAIISADLDREPSDVIHTLFHELFHKFQKDSLSGSLLNGAVYPPKEKLEEWAQEYINGGLSYKAYSLQPIEFDANEFAYETMIKEGFVMNDKLQEKHKELMDLQKFWQPNKEQGRTLKDLEYAERKMSLGEEGFEFSQAINWLNDFDKKSDRERLEEELKDPATRRAWEERLKRELSRFGRQSKGNLIEEILARTNIKIGDTSMSYTLPEKYMH